MIRTAGVYARRAEAASRFLEAMAGGLGGQASRHLRTLAFPSHNPVVAAVISERAKPSVQWATRPDGSFAILDGEIYNAGELCELKEAAGSNDADRVLHLYSRLGEHGVARLDAAAMLVIWDGPREELLVFRDCSGIVPCYYVEQPDGVVWASDIETLLRTNVPRDLHLPAIDFFLANGFVPAPWTLVKGIKKLPPAHVLRRSGTGSVTVRSYWRPVGQPKHNLDSRETSERLAMLFKQALHRRFTADPPTALLLSGGVDSKVIIAGLRKWLNVEFDAFTIGYADYSGIADELAAARSTAQFFGTRHHEIIMRPSDIADNLEWLLRSFGEPFTWGLRSFKLGDLAKAGVRSVFSGDGGDAWYLGKTEVFGLHMAGLPAALRGLVRASLPAVRRVSPGAEPSLAATLWCAETRLPGRCAERIMGAAVRGRLYRDGGWQPASRMAAEELFAAAAAEYTGESERDRMTFLHRRFFAAECNLYFNHWWGRAHGLAMRLPYHDAEVLDFVMRLPRNNTKKTEIRDLAATLMPADMAYESKIYQSVPIGNWFRGPLQEFLRDQLAPVRLKRQGLFDAAAVQQLVGEHVQGRGKHGMKLWAMLALLAWQEFVLNARPPTSATPTLVAPPIPGRPEFAHHPAPMRSKPTVALPAPRPLAAAGDPAMSASKPAPSRRHRRV